MKHRPADTKVNLCREIVYYIELYNLSENQ